MNITKTRVGRGYRFQAEDGQTTWAIRTHRTAHRWAVMQGTPGQDWRCIAHRHLLKDAEATARTILAAI